MTPIQEDAYRKAIKDVEDGTLSIDAIIRAWVEERYPAAINSCQVLVDRLKDEFDASPAVPTVLNMRAEKCGNSLWVDFCPSGCMPGDPKFDVARVRLEVWAGALWLRAWHGQETEGDPYLNECMYRFGNADEKEKTQQASAMDAAAEKQDGGNLPE